MKKFIVLAIAFLLPCSFAVAVDDQLYNGELVDATPEELVNVYRDFKMAGPCFFILHINRANKQNDYRIEKETIRIRMKYNSGKLVMASDVKQKKDILEVQPTQKGDVRFIYYPNISGKITGEIITAQVIKSKAKVTGVVTWAISLVSSGEIEGYPKTIIDKYCLYEKESKSMNYSQTVDVIYVSNEKGKPETIKSGTKISWANGFNVIKDLKGKEIKTPLETIIQQKNRSYAKAESWGIGTGDVGIFEEQNDGDDTSYTISIFYTDSGMMKQILNFSNYSYSNTEYEYKKIKGINFQNQMITKDRSFITDVTSTLKHKYEYEFNSE